MSSFSSRAKIAAGSVTLLGAALTAVFLLRQEPPPAAAPDKPPAELAHVAPASPPARLAEPAPVPQTAARPVPTAAARAAGTTAPAAKRELSFEVSDCHGLSLLSVVDGTATVQTGDSEPEQLRVGDLLESGEVTFVGKHPQSREPIVLLENEAKVACRAVRPRPLAALARVGPASARDFAAGSGVTGDPDRVETMALKLAPGTSAARADFGAAAR